MLKSNIRKIVLVTVISVVVATTGCSLFSPQAKLERLIASGKYEEAYSYYRENRSDISKSDAANLFETALDSMYESYLSGDISIDDIIDFVDDLEGIGSDSLDSYSQRIVEQANEIEVSREAFEDAETLFASNDYPGALEQYRLVIRDDPNYEVAQTQIEACIGNYKTEMMQEAADYIDSDNYPSAIDTLNALTAVIGNDSDVTNVLNDYLSQYSDYIFQTAQEMAESQQYDDALSYLEENSEYINDESQYNTIVAEYEDSAAQLLLQSNDVAGLVDAGDFDNAFSILNTIGDLYPNSESYAQQLAVAEDAYTDAELAIIQGFIDNSDYESAYDECVSALNQVSGRSELITQRDYCEQRLPVDLDECFSSESDEWGWRHPSSVDDLFGNHYAEGDAAGIYMDEYADFYLNGQYDILSLAVTPDEQFSEGYGSGIFRVYGDDNVIYEQAINNRTSPERFDINVSGVIWLRLEYEGVADPWKELNNLIIVDPELRCN